MRIGGHVPTSITFIRKILLTQLIAQLCTQLVHVVSCNWSRDDPPSPLYQPQLATWTSCAQNCANGCVTRITLFNNMIFSRGKKRLHDFQRESKPNPLV